MLGGEDWHLVGFDLGIRLNHGSGSESPAGSTGLLVLDRGDGSLLSPIHGLWELFATCKALDGGSSGGNGGLLVSSHVHGLELLISKVTELGHT